MAPPGFLTISKHVSKRLAMVYYEMTDGAGRMVAIENRSGIGWFNKEIGRAHV